VASKLGNCITAQRKAAKRHQLILDRLVLKVSVMNIKVYVNTAAVLDDVNTAVIFAPETRLKAKTKH